MNFRTMKRIGTFLLSLSLLVSQTGVNSYGNVEDVSQENTQVRVCEHHQTHTEDCGYSEGHECMHEHDESCYIQVPKCIYEGRDFATPPDGIPENHTCTIESGCVKELLDCHHTHDEECQYEENQPCSYVCPICQEGDQPEAAVVSYELMEGEAMGVLSVGDEFTIDQLRYKVKVSNDIQNEVEVIGHVDGKAATFLPEIPDKVTYGGVEYTVTAIGYAAFYQCKDLTGSIHLPATIKRVESLAFMYCGNLTGELHLPDGLEYIGRDAFSLCTGLSGELRFPDSLKVLSWGAFSDAAFTGELILPTGITTLESYTFQRCQNFTGKLVIPDNITTINEKIVNVTRFTSLKVPASVTNLSGQAFAQGDMLEYAELDVKEISSGLFYVCPVFQYMVAPRAEKIANNFCDSSVFNRMYLPENPPAVNGKFTFLRGNKKAYVCFVDSDGNLLPENQWIEAKARYQAVEDGNTGDNLWYGMILADYNQTFEPEIRAKKDNWSWNDCDRIFHLVAGETVITDLTKVPLGIYQIYDATDAAEGSLGLDTGKEITVDWANEVIDPLEYYSVTFYDNTAAYGNMTAQKPQVVLKGGKAIPPEAPEKTGYTFRGWVTANGGTTSFDFANTAITGKTSVYASWSDNSLLHSVTIAEGGTGSQGSGDYSEGDTVSISAGTKEGFTFSGWTGTDGVIFADAASADTTFTMPAGDVTVTANWTPVSTPTKSYQVVIGDGGTGSQGSGSYEAGTTVSISAGSKNGYEFLNWIGPDVVNFENASDPNTTFVMPAENIIITVNWEEQTLPVIKYQVTVNGGGTGSQGTGSYEAGTTVTIKAGTWEGHTFTNWTGPAGVTFANAADPNTTFVMPEGEVTITANWKEDEHTGGDSGDNGNSGGSSGDNGNSGGGSGDNGNSGGGSGDNGNSGGGSGDNGNSGGGSGDNGNSGGGSGDNGSSGGSGNNGSSEGSGNTGGGSGNSNSSDTTQSGQSANTPDSGVVNIPVQPNESGTASAIVTETVIADAIKNAQKESGSNMVTIKIDNSVNGGNSGNSANGSNSTNGGNSANDGNNATSTGASGSNMVTVNLPKVTMESIISHGIEETALAISQPNITVRLNLSGVRDIYQQANDDVDIKVTQVPVAAIPAEAGQAVGNRPAFRVSAMTAGSKTEIAALNQGTVGVEIPYTLQNGERPGNLYGVTLNETNGVNWLNNSSYDEKRQTLIMPTTRFTICGVGYQEKKVYSDISGHWAENDLEYAASRGLLAETGADSLSPDAPFTRGDLVMALGKLTGITPEDYPYTGQFEDVSFDDECSPYVKWAVSSGIISVPEITAFYPNQALIRGELAVILSDYAAKTGRTFNASRAAAIYSDGSLVSRGMKTAVQTIQQAGIMSGTTNRKFDSKAQVTRGMAAAVLHRYVETGITPNAAQGFHQNDSGQWQYFENGRPATGWRWINDHWYYFDNEGNMKTGVWCLINGQWYYFDESGAMNAGAWYLIEGRWYYFYLDGRMATQTIIDGMAVDEDGERIDS